jgi:hexosaminidase
MKPTDLRMIGAILLLLSLPVLSASAGRAAAPSLVPKPSSVLPSGAGFTLDRDVVVLIDQAHPEESNAAQFLVEMLQRSRALDLHMANAANGPAIRFRLRPNEAGAPAESYHVSVSARGASIEAGDGAGLFYGAVTLWQLATQRPGTGKVALSGVAITDAPRFAWRGLMIDSARHYQSPSYLKSFIAWMAIHKFNILHWHLTDDQAWRLEIKHFPKLTEIGGWRVPAGPAAAADIDVKTGMPRLYGGIYSQDQVRDIVAFAAKRHITIVPEIDMPGHATAAIAAYPELGVAPVTITAPSSDWGVFSNLLNVEDSTFAFIDTVIGEMADLFPSPYFHVGGDEAVKDQWKNSAEIQERMKQLGIVDAEALQSYFMTRLETILQRHGRKMIGWDEILQGGLAGDATVMSWRGIDGAVAAAKSGHDTILSPHPILYLDNRQGGSPYEPPGRGHIVTVQDIYDFDPMPADLSDAQQHHVLGVQGNLWTEHMRTEDQLTKMAYPRAIALAEIAWSHPAGRNWEDFKPRLDLQRLRNQTLGLQDDHPLPRPHDSRIYSQDLTLCSEKLPISLEDDAPVAGPRAVFLIDLMNPCWIYKGALLSSRSRLTANVGQVPFNFQIGKDRDLIRLNEPATPDGELDVRIDSCAGAVIAALPLQNAARNQAVTSLSAPLRAGPGPHDLCFSFTGKTIDPLWALNWIILDQISERP